MAQAQESVLCATSRSPQAYLKVELGYTGFFIIAITIAIVVVTIASTAAISAAAAAAPVLGYLCWFERSSLGAFTFVKFGSKGERKAMRGRENNVNITKRTTIDSLDWDSLQTTLFRSR